MSIRVGSAKPVHQGATYSAGDTLGEIMVFPHLLGQGVEGYITHVSLLDAANSGPELRLHLFSRRITAAADNQPMALSASELEDIEFFHSIDLPAASYVSLSTTLKKIDVPKLVLPVTAYDANMYGLLEVRANIESNLTQNKFTVTVTVQQL